MRFDSKRVLAAAITILATALLSVAPAKPAVAVVTNYAGAILADSPDAYYRLGEATNSTITDSSGNGRNAIVSNAAGFTAGVAGAPKGDADTAKSVDGSANTYAVDPQSLSQPNTFSQEVWVKTSSTRGGRVMGYSGSNATNTSSSSYDRQVWFSNNGTLNFGVNPYGYGTLIVKSSPGYNDGQWHLVTATLSSAGMKLYVDGLVVASDPRVTFAEAMPGYWRLGYDQMGGWPTNASDQSLNGSFDEWAVWNTVALSAAQISAHYAAGAMLANTANVATVVDPTFSFTVASHSGACNTVAQTAGVTTGATGVALGRVNSAAGSVAAQDLSVGTNANTGFSLQMRSPSALTAGSNTIANTPGTNASPTAFPASTTAAFGYTVSGLSRFVSAWAAPESVNREVMNGATVGTVTNCIAYRVQVTASTPAGTYATTAIYTAVPSF